LCHWVGPIVSLNSIIYVFLVSHYKFHVLFLHLWKISDDIKREEIIRILGQYSRSGFMRREFFIDLYSFNLDWQVISLEDTRFPLFLHHTTFSLFNFFLWYFIILDINIFIIFRYGLSYPFLSLLLIFRCLFVLNEILLLL